MSGPGKTAARVLLVDDHPMMRDGLRLLLSGQAEWQVVGSASSSEEGWRRVVGLRPDVVVMDLEMPGESGISLTARITAEFPATKVLVLTGSSEPGLVRAALGAGASGYLLKTDAGDQFLRALKAVLAGQVYLCPEVSTLVVHDFQRRASGAQGPEALSARETDVLRRIADGHTTKEIAFSMGVSAKTIETHRKKLMSKLGVTSVAGLTKHALREGLTTL